MSTGTLSKSGDVLQAGSTLAFGNTSTATGVLVNMGLVLYCSVTNGITSVAVPTVLSIGLSRNSTDGDDGDWEEWKQVSAKLGDDAVTEWIFDDIPAGAIWIRTVFANGDDTYNVTVHAEYQRVNSMGVA